MRPCKDLTQGSLPQGEPPAQYKLLAVKEDDLLGGTLTIVQLQPDETLCVQLSGFWPRSRLDEEC